MKNSVLSTRISSLYVFQPSPVVVCMQTAPLGPELIVSLGPRPHLWICAIETACLPLELGPSHNLCFYACKTAWLAPELQVSMGLSPRLCFLHDKQRLWTRITSLYGSQTSPVLLCMQNSVICAKMTSSHGFQPSSVVLCMQNSDFRTRIKSLCRWRDPIYGFCMQNSAFWPE